MSTVGFRGVTISHVTLSGSQYLLLIKYIVYIKTIQVKLMKYSVNSNAQYVSQNLWWTVRA